MLQSSQKFSDTLCGIVDFPYLNVCFLGSETLWLRIDLIISTSGKMDDMFTWRRNKKKLIDFMFWVRIWNMIWNLLSCNYIFLFFERNNLRSKFQVTFRWDQEVHKCLPKKFSVDFHCHLWTINIFLHLNFFI